LLKKELKSTYFTGLLLEASDNPKNLWNHINQIITNTRHKPHRKIAQLKTNEGIIDSPVEMAKVLNEHFVSVGSKLVERLQEDGSVAEKRPHDSGLDISGSLFSYPTDETKVLTVIKKFKKMSVDCEGFSNAMLKCCKEELAEPIAALINMSLQAGKVPNQLKKASVLF